MMQQRTRYRPSFPHVLLLLLLLVHCVADGLPRWVKRFTKKGPPPPPDVDPRSIVQQAAELPVYVWMLVAISISLVAIIGYFAYVIGLLDRPKFLAHPSVVWSSEDAHWKRHDKTSEYLYAIVALSTDREFGACIARLLPATSHAVGAAVPSHMPPTAAMRYGAPSGADSLSVALYFDDPAVVHQPRWALGWLIACDSFKEAQAYAKRAAAVFTEPEPLKAVRLGSGAVLCARIPWRHVLTPAVAPSLHWRRGFEAYSRAYPDRPSPMAAEFYVTGNRQSREWMDYVLFCDPIAQQTWKDVGYE